MKNFYNEKIFTTKKYLQRKNIYNEYFFTTKKLLQRKNFYNENTSCLKLLKFDTSFLKGYTPSTIKDEKHPNNKYENHLTKDEGYHTNKWGRCFGSCLARIVFDTKKYLHFYNQKIFVAKVFLQQFFIGIGSCFSHIIRNLQNLGLIWEVEVVRWLFLGQNRQKQHSFISETATL